MLTPYAILLVKSSDGDDVIRKAYYAVANTTHHDRTDDPEDRRRWYEAVDAYTAIKTEDLRKELERRQGLLSGVCDKCKGVGVVGTRLFKGKLRLCEACKGEGRRL